MKQLCDNLYDQRKAQIHRQERLLYTFAVLHKMGNADKIEMSNLQFGNGKLPVRSKLCVSMMIAPVENEPPSNRTRFKRLDKLKESEACPAK